MLLWIINHPQQDLSVSSLAAHVNMSVRNFARRFVKLTGVTPAKYVEQVRVDAARRRLEETDTALDVVAHRSGFTGAEQMRRTFLRHMFVSPADYRTRFRGIDKHTPDAHESGDKQFTHPKIADGVT